MKRRQKNRNGKRGRRYLKNGQTNNYILSRDFSDVEDAPNSFDLIKALVARAGKNAAAEAKVAGLPQTFARDNQVVTIDADGHEEIIETVESSGLKSNSYYVCYQPSTVLHARKK